MNNHAFASNNEFYEYVRTLGRPFLSAGFINEGNSLVTAMSTFYTTSSEAFGEIGLALLKIKRSEYAYPSSIAHDLEEALAAVRKIWPDIDCDLA